MKHAVDDTVSIRQLRWYHSAVNTTLAGCRNGITVRAPCVCLRVRCCTNCTQVYLRIYMHQSAYTLQHSVQSPHRAVLDSAMACMPPCGRACYQHQVLRTRHRCWPLLHMLWDPRQYHLVYLASHMGRHVPHTATAVDCMQAITMHHNSLLVPDVDHTKGDHMHRSHATDCPSAPVTHHHLCSCATVSCIIWATTTSPPAQQT